MSALARSSMPDSPKPLFDTLENLAANLERIDPLIDSYIQSSAIKQAQTDYLKAASFLYSYRGSSDTFASYRREIERLLHWCWFVRKIPLPQIKRQDIELFIDFCQSPPATWLGNKRVARFTDKEGLRVVNADWRPFIVKAGGQAALSSKAIQAIFSILSSFFTYLIQEDYLDSNPVSLIRQKSRYIRKHQQKAQIRRLTQMQWEYVIETAERLAAAEPEQHERTLFIIEALYGMYLRISELTATSRWTPSMGDFHMDTDGNWWFTTVGKGNKERDISVSDAMLSALKRYRIFLGLPRLPYPGENTPLIHKTRGPGGISSTRQIRNIVQYCFDQAVERMKKDGFIEDADMLRAATVHWLRHTGISDDVKHRPREHVRDDAGHGSSAITDKYIDVEMRERHRSAKHKTIKPQ